MGGLLGGGGDGQEQQMEALANAARGIEQYRPEAMQARLNLFSNASTAYQPVQNALETMYGGRGFNGPQSRQLAQQLTAGPGLPPGAKPGGGNPFGPPPIQAPTQAPNRNKI